MFRDVMIHVKYNNNKTNNNKNVKVPVKYNLKIIDWLRNANKTVDTIGNFMFTH